MTNQVQWKLLPTKANHQMEQAGADAAREYLERTGSNSLFKIYEAMAAAAPSVPAGHHQGEPVAWTPVKPVAPGAYWVRGNGLEKDALVQVIADRGELRCNLHQRTTETDFGWGYAVSDLSDEFEWFGPLHHHSDSGEVERLCAEIQCLRQHKTDYMEAAEETRKALLTQLAELDALLTSAYSDIEHASTRLGQCVSCGECPEDDDIITHDPSCTFCAIETALCASPKPIRSVLHDEQVAFETSYAREFSKVCGQEISAEDIASMRDSSGGYGDRAYLNGQWVGWQARAALEREELHG